MSALALANRAPICVGIPAHNWMYTRAVDSLLGMFRDDLPPRSKLCIEDGLSSCPAKRNMLVKGFLNAPPDYAHLLLLDADMIFPPGLVPRLLGHEKDVVGVPYTVRYPPFFIVGGRSSSSASVCDISFTPGTGLQPGDWLGGACLLIRRRVLAALEPPWFDNWRLDGPTRLDADDFYFCAKARAAGFELWCDTNVNVGHMTVAPVSPARAAEWRAAWAGDPFSQDLTAITPRLE